MRRCAILLSVLLAATTTLASGAPERRPRLLVPESSASRTVEREDGTIADARGLHLDAGTDPVSAAKKIAAEYSTSLFGSTMPPDLRLLDVRTSLTGTHVRLRQWIDGIEVVGGTFGVDFDSRGFGRTIHNRVARPERVASQKKLSSVRLDAAITGGRPVLEDRVVYLARDGVALLVRRIVVAVDRYRTEARYVDASGRVVMVEPLWLGATTRVFDPNPVTRTGDTSLHDENDSAAAVPEDAYSTVDLQGVETSGPLVGPNVSILDLELPSTTPTDLSKSLMFDRSDDQFEEVMAYFHIDRSQRYIQSLGYTGSRRVINRSLQVDAHAANGADNSYYRVQAGEGSLFFGDGGVDDAEDPDIIMHEYGHAIHEAIAPGAFTGASAGEGRALGEAFGDYWAFSSGYLDSVAFGRDPYCIGDWDARCADGSDNGCEYPVGANCLRRVDGTKTMADFIHTPIPGIEHANGEIVSSALREIFESIVARTGREQGRRIADRLVLESIFGLPYYTSYATFATSLLDADRNLDGGADHDAICTAMVDRLILPSSSCASGPRGEYVEFPAVATGLAIGDGGDPLVAARNVDRDGTVASVRVHVDIAHPDGGDLRLTLVGPGGQRVVLRNAGGDATPDIVATYGLDTEPAESLDVFKGAVARGDWSLEVVDTGSTGGGVLRSWTLEIEIDGVAPIDTRPASTEDSLHLLAVADASGAEGTKWVSDVSIRNATDSTKEVAAYFTPSGSDGRVDFRATRISLAPRQAVTLSDVVAGEFGTTGVGSIELGGDVAGVEMTSRNYNDASSGTYGQFIGSVPTRDGIVEGGPPLVVPEIEVSSSFRANLGVAEIGGASGTVEVVVLDGDGTELDRFSFGIPAWSQLQIPLLSDTSAATARAVVRVASGGARIAAYGSIVDNRSGDPIYVPAVPSDAAATVRRVPAAGNVHGALGTQWRTDLWLTNPSTSDQPVTLGFLPANGSAASSVDVTVPAGKIVAIPDVVSTRFGLTEATGQLSVSSSPLIVTSRTWNENANGTYGQFVQSVDASGGVGSNDGALEAIGLTMSDSFRTNVGVTEIGGTGATVKITVLDSGGSALREVSIFVPANGQVQFGLGDIGVDSLRDGVVRFEVTGGSGRIVAYASMVDNRSSDPTYIPAMP